MHLDNERRMMIMKTNYKYAFCENCFDDVEYEIRENIPMSEL